MTTTKHLPAALLALVVALGLSAAHNLDGPTDHQAEWAQSQALQELQASQASTARHEAAAQALCAQERGPNSEARFTPEGHLVCSTRRGLVLATAKAVQP